MGSSIQEFIYNTAGQHVSIWSGSTGSELEGKYYWGANGAGFYGGGTTFFQHRDWLGSERMTTTYNGAVNGTYGNLSSGDQQANTGPDGGYALLDYDAETTTSHAQFRQYNSTQGRFMSPDPSGLVFADPTNPQSLNLYAYVMNNPLIRIDPKGLDCVYFIDPGNGIKSIDPQDSAQNQGTSLDQQSSDCGMNGGDWVNGTTSTDLASYNSNTDTWNIASYGSERGTPTIYWTEASAPGPQSSGIPCSGNCDTANGYSSTGYAFFSNQLPAGSWFNALHWAVGQTWQVSKFQKWIISDPDGRNWCGAGGMGTPSGSDDWSCMAHDYSYMTTGNTWPGDNLIPFSGNKQLQEINQTLCNNVSSPNVKNFFTYTSFAGCH